MSPISPTPHGIYQWIRKNRPEVIVSDNSKFRDAAKEALLESLGKNFRDLNSLEQDKLAKFVRYFGSYVPSILKQKKWHPEVFKKPYFSKIISLESSVENHDDSGIPMETDEVDQSLPPADVQGPDSSEIKDFLSKSARQQRRDVLKITEGFDHDAILAAAAEVLKIRGFNDAAFVLKKMESDAENLGNKLRQVLDKPDHGDDAIPPERYIVIPAIKECNL